MKAVEAHNAGVSWGLFEDSPEQVLDAVKWPAGSETPVAVVGRGSKQGFGRPAEAEHCLDLSRVSGIGRYEPN